MMNGGDERGPSQTAERIRVPKPYEVEGSPEMERAKRYWRERLAGEQRIKEPQHPACKLGIVVPVFNEDVRRLAQQLDSLRAQKDIHPDQFEVLYVVNNDRDDGSRRALDIRAKNLHVAGYLEQDQKMHVHVIDKSSPGNTIADCNVGRARNRGVAEAGVRFYEQGKNGILLQTDADTWFEDPYHLAKICAEFDKDPLAIGMAGGVLYEWDPDERDPGERKKLFEKFERMKVYKRYKAMAAFLNGSIKQGPDLDSRPRFSGCHMLSRSLETAMVGGLRDDNQGEDPALSDGLLEFASSYGQRVLSRRRELKVVTAFRESDRTKASFMGIFKELKTRDFFSVPDALPDVQLPEFRHIFYGKIKAAYKQKDLQTIRALLTNSREQLLVPEEMLQTVESGLHSKAFTNFRDMLSFLYKAYTGKKTLLEALYEDAYPPVELTTEYLDRVRQRVESRPGGREFLGQLEDFYSSIRIPEKGGIY